jgi:cytochrome c
MQMLLKNCEENQMIKRFVLKSSVVLGVFAAGILTMPTAQAADEAAARELARANNCFKCHALDKDKDGPDLNAVA